MIFIDFCAYHDIMKKPFCLPLRLLHSLCYASLADSYNCNAASRSHTISTVKLIPLLQPPPPNLPDTLPPNIQCCIC